MKCYNHHERDGIGICYHCQKAICNDCSTIVEKRMSCIGQCEKKVEEIATYLDNCIKISKTNKDAEKDWYSSSIILIIIGSIVATIELMNNDELGFVFSLGITLCLLGFYSLFKTYSYSKKADKNS